MRKLFVLLLGLSFTGLAQPATLYLQTSEVHNLMVHFEADRGSLMRFYSIQNSPERRERLKQFYTDYLKRLEQLPFENFSQGGKVDYILFKRNLEEALYELSVEEKEYNQIRKFVAMGDPLYELEKKRRRGYSLNSEEVAQTLNNVRKQVEEANRQLAQQPNLSPELTQRAAQTVIGLKNALRSVYGFYNQYDPLFTWWVEKPYQQLDTLLGTYAQNLRKKVDVTKLPKDDGSGIIGQPIGRDEIIRQLKLEFIP